MQPEDKFTNPILGNTLKNLAESGENSGFAFFKLTIPNFITLGFIIGALVFFFFMLIGAIQWMTSGGDKSAVEAARNKLTNALIGLFVLFALFAIINVIEVFFDISILNLDLGALKIQ